MASLEHNDRYEAGYRIRKEVMGEAYVDATLSKVSEFSALGQQIATEHAWGSIWTRDGLDRKQRSLVTITMLATVGKHTELAGHIRGALTNGLTEKEIQECMAQVMVYMGMPTGLEAFRTADAAIAKYKADMEDK